MLCRATNDNTLILLFEAAFGVILPGQIGINLLTENLKLGECQLDPSVQHLGMFGFKDTKFFQLVFFYVLLPEWKAEIARLATVNANGEANEPNIPLHTYARAWSSWDDWRKASTYGDLRRRLRQIQ